MSLILTALVDAEALHMSPPMPQQLSPNSRGRFLHSLSEAAICDAAEPSSSGADAQAAADQAAQSAKVRKESVPAQLCTASCLLQAGHWLA